MEGVATLKGETLYETKPLPVRNGEFILGGHSCRVVVTEDAPPVNTTSGSCNGGPRSASAIARRLKKRPPRMPSYGYPAGRSQGARLSLRRRPIQHQLRAPGA